MFPREQRLTLHRVFEQVFRRGSRVRGKHISVIFLKASDGRIGFVMTKKSSKSAVIRNASKRRVRALLREFFAQPEYAALPQHNHLVFVIHRPVGELPADELRQELQGMLMKVVPAS